MANEKIAMGINLRQNKNSNTSAYGKYYPEVDQQKTLSLRGFAKHLTDHGSRWGRDEVEGVLMKITECLPELVAQGVPVQLGNLGTFYPTAEVAKNGGVRDIPDMDGLNPNDIVKAIHIRFLPDATKLDNLCGPQFKDRCTLELRNIVDTIEVTVNGKKKKVQTLKPIATAVAEWKAQNGQGGQSGNSQSGESGNSGESGGSGFVLTISKTGTGTASVTSSGNAVNSGDSLSEDAEVEISITPAEGKVPTASVNGSSIELTEDSGVYSGSFAMPGQASSLVIETGTAEGGDSGDGIDKD